MCGVVGGRGGEGGSLWGWITKDLVHSGKLAVLNTNEELKLV